jgi:hypothetical protein
MLHSLVISVLFHTAAAPPPSEACGAAMPVWSIAAAVAADAMIVGTAVLVTGPLSTSGAAYPVVAIGAAALPAATLVGVPWIVTEICGVPYPWQRGALSLGGYIVGGVFGLAAGGMIGAAIGDASDPDARPPPSALFWFSPAAWGALIGAPIGALGMAPVGAGLAAWIVADFE